MYCGVPFIYKHSCDPISDTFQYPNQSHIFTLNVHLVVLITVFKAQECAEWKTIKCLIQLFSSKSLQEHPLHIFLLIYFQRYATLHSLFISGKLFYMFRVVSSPIISSTYNCIYSIWYFLTITVIWNISVFTFTLYLE